MAIATCPTCVVADGPAGHKAHDVYLAGPITGRAEDWEWRAEAVRRLREAGLTVHNPLADVAGPEQIGAEGLLLDNDFVPASRARADKEALRACRAVLVHVEYLPITRPTWGTPWELGIAEERGMPILLSSPYVAVRRHPFTLDGCRHVTTELDDAIQAVIDIVNSNPR